MLKILQSRGNGVNRGSNSQFPINTRYIRGQDALIGSLLFLGKKAPTPRLKASIFMEYSKASGKISASPVDLEIAEEIDKMLSGRLDENDDEFKEISGIIGADVVEGGDDESYDDME